MVVSGGINHIVLRVHSLPASEAFYVDLLGLKQVGHRPSMHFYSSGHYNHELALIEDPGISSADIQNGGLVHLAFNVESQSALKALRNQLIDADYAVSSGVDHNIAHSFYTHDPDGYTIELTTDRDSKEWASDIQAFEKDKPLQL